MVRAIAGLLRARRTNCKAQSHAQGFRAVATVLLGFIGCHPLAARIELRFEQLLRAVEISTNGATPAAGRRYHSCVSRGEPRRCVARYSAASFRLRGRLGSRTGALWLSSQDQTPGSVS